MLELPQVEGLIRKAQEMQGDLVNNIVAVCNEKRKLPAIQEIVALPQEQVVRIGNRLATQYEMWQEDDTAQAEAARTAHNASTSTGDYQLPDEQVQKDKVSHPGLTCIKKAEKKIAEAEQAIEDSKCKAFPSDPQLLKSLAEAAAELKDKGIGRLQKSIDGVVQKCHQRITTETKDYNPPELPPND
jgi:hypothetical protein